MEMWYWLSCNSSTAEQVDALRDRWRRSDGDGQSGRSEN